jgi:ketosteroid isomerase-like protein
MSGWRTLYLLAALLLLTSAGCVRAPPEQALREAVSELQRAVEARDAAAVHDLLADDFIGPEGLDREGARRLAQGMFLRYRGVGATIGPLEIVLQDQHATVRFDAVVTGGSGGLLPESGQAYDVETGWRMERDEWRLVNAQWRQKL